VNTTTPSSTPPIEIALGRLICRTVDILEREMAQLFEDYIDGETNRWGEPRYELARGACRLMISCRSLAEEFRRYEVERKKQEDIDNLGF
jgi:hypothetical protein